MAKTRSRVRSPSSIGPAHGRAELVETKSPRRPPYNSWRFPTFVGGAFRQSEAGFAEGRWSSLGHLSTANRRVPITRGAPKKGVGLNLISAAEQSSPPLHSPTPSPGGSVLDLQLVRDRVGGLKSAIFLSSSVD
jgi:hypothetical protein